jgi:hypothetical protein
MGHLDSEGKAEESHDAAQALEACERSSAEVIEQDEGLAMRLHLFTGYEHEGSDYDQSFDTFKEIREFMRKNPGRKAYGSVMAEIDGDLKELAFVRVEKGKASWEMVSVPWPEGVRET